MEESTGRRDAGVMVDIKKERMMTGIVSLAGISCILQNYFGSWEFWVPPLVAVGMILLWWIHITQKMSASARAGLCFAFSSFLLFYLGIHDTSFFDISVAAALFMATFTVLDSTNMLTLIMAEYALVMAIQFYFCFEYGQFPMDAFTIMRTVFHIGTVFTMYIFSYMTVRSRVEEKKKLAEWQDAVQDNNRDMEDFLSNISHELRTPINVISGMTTLLQKNQSNTELDSIQEAGIRLAHQIEDIQDYTELKRGELILEEENYMCISLINDVVSIFKAHSQKQNLELVVDLDPETPAMLNGDIKKLHKLFRHLMENAIKFTGRGGIYIHVFATHREYGVNLTIEVTDTGIGMTRADMSRVTKGMYQANKKRNRSTGGIGIGLPIVYGFVHKMGGFVHINSAKGKGTTVRISIPQRVVDPAPCLMLKEDVKEGLVFYIKPEKYRVPEVREFNRMMAVHLATGLNAKLYTAAECRILEKMVGEMKISHIFTGPEEYEADHLLLDRLAKEGISVIVSANEGFRLTPGSRAMVMPKPLYGFPVVRIMNKEGIAEALGADVSGKLCLDGVRALVVDDEPMNLVVATGLLKDYRMSVDTAGSGKEAIQKYENGEYDVIYMDHMMPGMDGVEAMKRIRQVAAQSGRNAVVVALTANALSGAREMFLREGFDGFIAKPIDMGEFERVMKRVLPEEMQHYESEG